MIAGVLTANELSLLRTRPQRTQLYLAIPAYKTIYTARVNNAPASNDNVRNIEYDGGAAAAGHTINDVVMDMTVLIGSTAGAFDIGMARMRSTILDLGGGTGLMPIGSTSELELANDQYLTVIDDFGLWPKHPYISVAGIMYMDYDTAYTNENVYGDPVPIMGTHAVLELTGASVSASFDASDSYTCIGTPDHYDFAWYVDGVLVSNADNVNIAFTSVGTYLVKLEVTADYAIGSPVIEKTSVTYRYVIVYNKTNPLNASFMLDSCSGSYDEGGWSYRVTMNAKASEAYVRDRTLCLLVARDWYGDTEQSIGPLAGRENIVCAGWVDGESIRRSNDRSRVSFDVQGPAFWLGVQEGFPTGIDDTNATPTDWSHIQQLDPRKGLFSFLHWRTTSTVVMDCYITADDHRLATTYTPAGSLLEQLRAIAERVNAKTCCDRYGRLFCEIDTQFIDPALRVPPTFPVVQTFMDRDWRDEISIERRTVGQAGQVDLSGVYYSGDLATSNAIFSLAPGHIPSHYGEKRKVERIALDNQTEANLLAGLWHGYYNNEFPNVDTPLSANHRAFDVAPRMFAQMNLAAADTPRGITWVDKKLIPRQVTFNYDAREALMLTDITFEAEAFASPAVTGDPPLEPPDPPIIITPPPPTLCNDPTALNFGGLAPCINVPGVDIVVVKTGTKLAYSTNAISDPANANWNNITPAGLTGTMEAIAVSNSGELWLAIKSVVGDAWEGVWYTSDLTTTPLSRILSTATARTDMGGAGAGIHFDANCFCMVGTECYVTAHGNMPDTTSFHYWHGNGTLTHDVCVCAVPLVTSTNGSSCTDGATVRYGMNAGGRNSWVINVVACTQIFQAPPYLIGGNLFIASETYAVNDDTKIYTTAPGAWVAVYTGASAARQLIEFGGSLFWTRVADYALMKDAAVQALTNDAGGVNGIFSTIGATGGEYVVIDASTIIWIAHSADASNNRRNMAMTQDGGVTWVSIDGDWNAAIATWNGGVGGSGNTMVKYCSV